MNSYQVRVNVSRIVSKKELDPDDRRFNPTGEYEFEVEAENSLHAAEKALDEFHRTVPIACLEDFAIDTLVTNSNAVACGDPYCPGWDLFAVDGEDRVEVQKCDECRRFEDDENAAKAAREWVQIARRDQEKYRQLQTIGRKLCAWAEMQGGWEAPVWKELERAVKEEK